MKKYKGYIAFDFDGVISSYNRPFKFNKFGKPQKSIIDTMKYYYDKEYYILIFSGRLKTKKLVEWLKLNNVPYHGINIQPKFLKGTNNKKPYYHVFIDDKAINFHWKYNCKSSKQLIKEIDKKLKWAKK